MCHILMQEGEIRLVDDPESEALQQQQQQQAAAQQSQQQQSAQHQQQQNPFSGDATGASKSGALSSTAIAAALADPVLGSELGPLRAPAAGGGGGSGEGGCGPGGGGGGGGGTVEAAAMAAVAAMAAAGGAGQAMQVGGGASGRHGEELVGGASKGRADSTNNSQPRGVARRGWRIQPRADSHCH